MIYKWRLKLNTLELFYTVRLFFCGGKWVCIVACPVQFPWTQQISVFLTVQIQKKVNRRSVFLELQLIIINSVFLVFSPFDYVIEKITFIMKVLWMLK